MTAPVNVIGAGLAGCEAAWQLSRHNIAVRLVEMKPQKYSAAHKYSGFSELVCSNSLKAMRLSSAAGLLKEADRVPAAGLLTGADRVPEEHPPERAAPKAAGTETGTAADRAEDES